MTVRPTSDRDRTCGVGTVDQSYRLLIAARRTLGIAVARRLSLRSNWVGAASASGPTEDSTKPAVGPFARERLSLVYR